MSRKNSAVRDTNVKTAQLVQLISEIGPDIPEISRQLGQFKESVRYRYKEKVLGSRMAIQAMVNHEALGLRRVMAVLDFAPEYKTYAETILTAMSELCYVVSFERLFPRGAYNVAASVPAEFVDDYTRLLERLSQKGLFSLSDVHVFDWFRNMPMQVRYYDFESGRWDFDWSTRPDGDFEMARYMPSGDIPFDSTDLLLLKELFIDATRPLSEISKKVGVNYKKLAWHYSKHVVSRRLVKGYIVRWPGTMYDFKADRALHRQHRYFWVDVLARDLTEKERMAVMAGLSGLPFLWAEAVGKDFFAQLALPVDFMTEALQFVEEALSGVRDKAELWLPDQTHALGFTICYKLYDEELGKWTFDPLSIEAKFDEFILKAKEVGTGAEPR